MNEQQTFNFQLEIEQIRKAFDFDLVALALVHPAERRFTSKWEYVTGNKSNRYKRLTLQTGKGVAGAVLKTGKPLLMSDVKSLIDEGELFNYPIIVAEKLTSFGAIPLYKYNRVKGVLLVAFRDDKVLTEEVFKKFKETIGSRFGPYYNKEMVK
ncbi:GAF domain-containing protein [Sporosarcina sp. Marseille-Q4063]|uniref:GAF domain-containing protein n=1 Tax=Sporosarcina sp. Marseille-Q4063 TaxID=2810514 RepID=UPI001BAF5D3A|nr:GAF domain-containing protein [Sporosarcina sp. Marseille-Q4063]QUW21028.1 GAF domain-containing protein [Sporosarcina sp. Marseille-Q4063]